MSVKNIPERVVFKCDRCGNEGERYKEGAFASGGMHIRRAESWGMGYDGAVGGIHLDFDFCSRCSQRFDEWLISAR